VLEQEVELFFEGGRTTHLLMRAVPLFDAQGNLRGSVEAALDVTTRKHAEEALRASEEGSA